MAYASCPGTMFNGALRSQGAKTLTSLRLDSNSGSDAISAIWHCTRTGTIDRLLMLPTATAGTLSGIDFTASIQSAVSEAPDGTILGGGSPASLDILGNNFSANTMFTATLTNSLAVTKGDELAFVLETKTGQDASNYIEFAYRLTTGFGSIHHPFAATKTNGGAWSSVSSLPSVVPVYSDDWIPYGFSLVQTLDNNVTFANDSTPDEYGLHMTMPFGCKCDGLVYLTAESGDRAVKVYRDTTELYTTGAMDTSDIHEGTSSFREVFVAFDEIELSSGDEIRWTVQPSSTTNAGLPTASFATAAHQLQHCGLGQLTTRTDAGSWSNTSTTYPFIFPIFSAVDIPDGGGGNNRLVNGGLVVS